MGFSTGATQPPIPQTGSTQTFEQASDALVAKQQLQSLKQMETSNTLSTLGQTTQMCISADTSSVERTKTTCTASEQAARKSG
jgi:hypothetical protein